MKEEKKVKDITLFDIAKMVESDPTIQELVEENQRKIVSILSVRR